MLLGNGDYQVQVVGLRKFIDAIFNVLVLKVMVLGIQILQCCFKKNQFVRCIRTEMAVFVINIEYVQLSVEFLYKRFL